MTQEDLDKTRWRGTSYSLETDQFEVSFSDTTNCIPKLTMIIKYNGRAIGIDTIATTIGEEPETVEDVYEPYLIQIGFIARTARGRIPMPIAYKHIGVSYEEK